MKVFVPFSEVLIERLGLNIGELVPFQLEYECLHRQDQKRYFRCSRNRSASLSKISGLAQLTTSRHSVRRANLWVSAP